MRHHLTIALGAALLSAPTMAQTAPSTAGGASSADPQSSESGAENEITPDASGGTTGTVELPGGGTVTEPRTNGEEKQETRSGGDTTNASPSTDEAGASKASGGQ